MRKNYLLLLMLAFTFSVGSTVSYASDDEYDDEDDEEIIITLSGNNGASGKVTIEVEEYGVDSFKLKAKDLAPNTRYSVFLTESPVPGALPAQFLGEFTSNSKGKGKFKAKTEIVNAFASANQSVEDDLGIANMLPPPPAGAIGNGANTIALDWIRVYVIPPAGGNVFGGSESEPGGALVLRSDEALP
jgi:hypothetical protein